MNDQEALIGLIEDLSGLAGNDGDLKIAFCHFTDLIQNNYESGVQTVLEIAKNKLVENLNVLMDIFTSEDKQEPAFDFLLRMVGQNPQLLSPFNWASMRTRNSLDDLKRATSQSRAAVCHRIVYDSAATKA